MVLVPIDGGRPIALDKAIMFFGRGSECDIVLGDSRKVSRKHCCIAQIDDYYIIRDLGSMNGLRVNNEAVPGEMQLSVGDEVWVGDVGFRFDSPTNSQSPEATQPVSPGDAASPQIRSLDYISQDIPVVLPDEGVDFDVEETRARRVIPQDEVIELDDSEIADED